MIETGFLGRYLFSGHIYKEIWKYGEITPGSRGTGVNVLMQNELRYLRKTKVSLASCLLHLGKKCGKRWVQRGGHKTVHEGADQWKECGFWFRLVMKPLEHLSREVTWFVLCIKNSSRTSAMGRWNTCTFPILSTKYN